MVTIPFFAKFHTCWVVLMYRLSHHLRRVWHTSFRWLFGISERWFTFNFILQLITNTFFGTIKEKPLRYIPPNKNRHDNGTSTIWRCNSSWTWGIFQCHVSFQGCIYVGLLPFEVVFIVMSLTFLPFLNVDFEVWESCQNPIPST